MNVLRKKMIRPCVCYKIKLATSNLFIQCVYIHRSDYTVYPPTEMGMFDVGKCWPFVSKLNFLFSILFLIGRVTNAKGCVLFDWFQNIYILYTVQWISDVQSIATEWKTQYTCPNLRNEANIYDSHVECSSHGAKPKSSFDNRRKM